MKNNPWFQEIQWTEYKDKYKENFRSYYSKNYYEKIFKTD